MKQVLASIAFIVVIGSTVGFPAQDAAIDSVEKPAVSTHEFTSHLIKLPVCPSYNQFGTFNNPSTDL